MSQASSVRIPTITPAGAAVFSRLNDCSALRAAVRSPRATAVRPLTTRPSRDESAGADRNRSGSYPYATSSSSDWRTRLRARRESLLSTASSRPFSRRSWAAFLRPWAASEAALMSSARSSTGRGRCGSRSSPTARLSARVQSSSATRRRRWGRRDSDWGPGSSNEKGARSLRRPLEFRRSRAVTSCRGGRFDGRPSGHRDGPRGRRGDPRDGPGDLRASPGGSRGGRRASRRARSASCADMNASDCAAPARSDAAGRATRPEEMVVVDQRRQGTQGVPAVPAGARPAGTTTHPRGGQ